MDNSSHSQSNLYFFNGNKPIFTGLGSNSSYAALVNTSSSWVPFNLDAGTLAERSGNSSVYSTSSQAWATSFVLNGGILKFSTTSLFTYAPTTTQIYPVQSISQGGPSIGIISVTTTVSDLEGDDVNLLIEMSADGLSWGVTTISSPLVSVGTITTSTSHIFGIDTSMGSNDISFSITLLQGTGVDGYDGPAYVRITPYDDYYTGTPRISNSFNVDLAQPTPPGNLSGYSVGTSSVVLNLPSTTSTDTNFSQYKIFYSTVSPVTVTSSAFTSSSDINLSNNNFNGATTTIITGLSTGTTYYFKIFSFDIYNNSTSSVAEFSTTTISVPYSGILPAVSSDAKTKLLLVDGVYYFGFTSSTANGSYHLFVMKSASGQNGTWSQPVDVFDYGIYLDDTEGGIKNGLFALDYNNSSGYFGAAIYATGTPSIWYASSANGVVWSTSTVVSNLSTNNLIKRVLYLDFSNSNNFATIFYHDNNYGVYYINVATSTNNGATWSSGTTLLADGELVGGKVTGSAASHIFHTSYFVTNPSSTDFYDLIYATSTNGITWSTSTVSNDVNTTFGDVTLNYLGMIGFDLDSNLVPAFTYWKATALGPLDAPPYNTTSSLIYVSGNGSGGWNASTTIATNVHWLLSDTKQRGSHLFFSGTTPIFVGFSSLYSLVGAVNTSTWNTFSIDSALLNENASVSAVYNTSSQFLASTYVVSGNLMFATTSLNLTIDSGVAIAPTITSIDQNTTTSLRVNWTSGNGAETEFVLQASEDGGVIFETVTTTPTSTTNFVLDALITPNTEYFVRLIASSTNSQATSSIASSYTSSTDPISLVVSAVTTSTLTLVWGDNNNPTSTDYQIFGNGFATTTVTNATTTNLTGLTPSTSYTFYVRAQNAGNTSTYSGSVGVATTTLAAATPVPVAPTSLFTSDIATSTATINWVSGNGDENIFFLEVSSDGGLTFPNFATTSAASTTYNLVNLFSNFQYYVRLSAAIEGVSTSSVTTTSFYTSSTAPVLPLITNITTTSLTLTWGADGNASSTNYRVIGNNNFSTTTISAATTTNISGLIPNTNYIFTVQAQNAGSTSTYSSAVSTDVTSTLAAVPGTPIATVSTTSQIDLTWSANNNSGTTVYEVYNVTDVVLVNTTTATSYSVTNVTTTGAYQFKIRAVNVGSGYSAYSDTSTASDIWGFPAVSTVSASSVSTSSVTYNGNITSIGGTTVNARGFVYGTSTNYGVTSTESGSYGTGAFTVSIDSLNMATPYHYKAFATNAVGTIYGLDVVFITVSAPTVNAPTTTITSYNISTTTISVPLVVTNAAVDLSSITDSNSTTLPGAISVDSITSLGTVYLAIASGTLVTADASWDGIIYLPTVQSNSSVTGVADSGYTATVSGVLEIGYGDVALTLSKGARILIPNMTGKSVGYYRDGAFTKISSTCAADSQSVGDALDAGADCKINSGSDLVVWTKHFTKFAVYSQTQNTTGGSGNSGGGSDTPSEPVSPTVLAPTILNQVFSVNGSTEVKIGNVSHKVQINKIDLINNQVTFTIESTPIIFTLKVNEEKVLDTDGDQENDIRVKLNNINTINKTVNLTIVSIADLQFSINRFALTTTNRDVVLYFNSPEAKQMAISESSNFVGASFETYTKTKKWKLSEGAGYKKLYVKFRTAQGGVKIISSEIKLVDSTVLTVVPSVVSSPLSSSFVFKKNLSVGSVGNDVKQLQMALKQLGYYKYFKFTNTFGSYTSQAVKKFQIANKILPANGSFGTKTREKLNSQNGLSVQKPSAVSIEADKFIFNMNLSLGMINNDVKELQKYLNNNGFVLAKSGAGSLGHETAKFGAITRAAVIKFQKANNIDPANGLFGPATRKIVNNMQ